MQPEHSKMQSVQLSQCCEGALTDDMAVCLFYV